jgi:hypothetical protein
VNEAASLVVGELYVVDAGHAAAVDLVVEHQEVCESDLPLDRGVGRRAGG